MDTLAAAYAANGLFSEAVETQNKAISRLKEKKAKDDVISDYNKRLELYKNKRSLYLSNY